MCQVTRYPTVTLWVTANPNCLGLTAAAGKSHSVPPASSNSQQLKLPHLHLARRACSSRELPRISAAAGRCFADATGARQAPLFCVSIYLAGYCLARWVPCRRRAEQAVLSTIYISSSSHARLPACALLPGHVCQPSPTVKAGAARPRLHRQVSVRSACNL